MLACKSLNRWGISALFLGACTGLFFSSFSIFWLTSLANAFSMLLQMAVFPYIYLSFIVGVGSILAPDAYRLVKYGLLCIGGMWALAYFFLYFLNQIIPAPLPSLIISETNEGQQSALQSLLESLIPESGLEALGNNMILAGIAFGLLFGAALMHTEKKECLLPYLERSLQLLERIFEWLCRIAPIGVFLYIAIAFANIRFTDILHIEFYFLSRIIFPIFFVLLVIPLVVSSFTHLSARGVLRLLLKICLLPFLAGSTILIVPFLARYARSNELKHIILPAAYCLGQIGIAMNIFVLSYLSFYYRLSFSWIEKMSIYFRLSPISMQDSFTSLNTAFLTDQFHFPVSGVQLHAESALILHHFLVLLSVASIVAITLLMQAAFNNELRIQRTRLIGSFAGVSLLFIASTYGTRPFFHLVDYYQGLYQHLTISDVIEHPVQVTVVPLGETGTSRDPTKSTFAQILETGVLKVGIKEFSIPYSYRNDFGELVGYDIAYAHQLARDLDCSLELVIVDPDKIGEELASGDYDLGMASFLMTEERIQSMAFSNPYREEENILIVPRSKQDEFMNLEDVKHRTLTILAEGAYISIAKQYFPQAQILSESPPFLLENRQVDACLWARTSGNIWCLSNPEFVSIDYGAMLGSCYLGYPIRENAITFAAFLNNWLRLKEQMGFQQTMIQYWIKGTRS